MKSLADDLVVTCDEVADTPESVPINPSDGINYQHIAVALLAITSLLLFVDIVFKLCMKLELTILCLFYINREMIDVRETNIKNRTYYFFDDTVIVKNLDLDNIV